MQLRWIPRFFAAFLVGLMASGPAFAQQEVVLEPVKDNTLFEDANGGLSNGAGDFLYTGVTGQDRIRRAVLAFDVAGVLPEGATVETIELTLNVSKTPPGADPQLTTLHRLLADWGEGLSDAGDPGGGGATAVADDATWVHTFFDTATWQTPGGDFEATPSASLDVEDLDAYTWGSTDALVADVQGWLDDPATNFGWIIVGNEAATQTARRFDSRENPDAAARPALRITYLMPVAIEQDDIPTTAHLRTVYPNPARATATFVIDLAQPQPVTLDVFDVRGRKVATPVAGLHYAGQHDVTFDTASLPAGLYLYRLQTDQTITHGTLVVQH